MHLLDSIVSEAAQLTAIRRDLHAHPELCFKEERTSEMVANLLKRWGIPFHTGLGKTGVVGVIKGRLGHSTRAIGLRADMDALPDQRFENAWAAAGPEIHQRIQGGEKILIHCRGGLGRTGLVAGLILVERGCAPRDAIQQVRAARRGAIETVAQECYVLRAKGRQPGESHE